MNFEERIRCNIIKNKVMSAEEAALLIKDGMTIGTSGFVTGGPKAVPLAIAERYKNEKIKLNLYTGAIVGDELDGAFAREGLVNKRIPYQTNKDMRNAINNGSVKFIDMHLSHMPQQIRYGFLGKIDIAIIEATAITEDGGIIPTMSVGNSPTFVNMADKVIVEINTSQPIELEGMHDIYEPKDPPYREPIPILKVSDRIGVPYIPCNPDKIAAVVFSDMKDTTLQLTSINETSKKISDYLIDFLQTEIKHGRLPKTFLPLQSGVGNVANAVLGGFIELKYNNLNLYSEVIQDAVLDLIDADKVEKVSGTALTLSEEGLKRFYTNINKYKEKIILRPQEISNNPEIIRRLGVISINTAIEVDIYGNVNSTHILGTKMMNGIGGSADFTRNAYISIFATPSTAKDDNISCIVPMVSHVDHTEHDVMVVVTEQGLADLRGLSPKERAIAIIKNCAHPDYKDVLMEYYERAIKKHGAVQTPNLLDEAFLWHTRYSNTGSMKI
ncbi:acetyl-CoA hydrolase/transferase family protein [Thermoanaerobacterium thermosaccharolyticum]|uniref:Succinate CoA transferase n=1 Tax=Thermoanaerobacterium thermosaccharolyticum M0795 TaxID=698948 RepID=L0IKE9_THETR|nr:acetyl-CoA hydrolase/transferase family protein [Thermoanaerobacterium thermosaccharolyticum]AGB19298.1 succinate CoA transferase [Thermoanaerobacterium thermosaccharolyticum M0795]